RGKLGERRPFIAQNIMRSMWLDDRPNWELASPITRVHADAPPFFVMHGTNDSLLLVEDARHFVAALRAVSRQPVCYAELPGAQHAFDPLKSMRALAVVDGVAQFLAWV